MNIIKKLKICFFAFMTCLCIVACGSEKKSEKNKNSEKSSQKSVPINISENYDGIILNVVSDSDSYSKGDSFTIKASLENNTDKPVYLTVCGSDEIQITSELNGWFLYENGSKDGIEQEPSMTVIKLEPGETIEKTKKFLADDTGVCNCKIVFYINSNESDAKNFQGKEELNFEISIVE